MPGMQAARKHGSKPQAAQQQGAAKAPQEKEFGADMAFHALRLHDPAEQATLNTQAGVNELTQQHRSCYCPPQPGCHCMIFNPAGVTRRAHILLYTYWERASRIWGWVFIAVRV